MGQRETSINRLKEVMVTVNPRVVSDAIWTPIFSGKNDDQTIPDFIIVKIGYKLKITNQSDVDGFHSIVNSTFSDIEWICSTGSFGILEFDDGTEITIHVV